MHIMGAVLLLLIGVTDGVKTVCDATQPDITTQCFGSLGGTVEVQLPTQSSRYNTYRLRKNRVPILSERNQTNIRYSLNVRTGIFTIKDIDRTDNGEYSMEVHNIYGIEFENTKCYLTIQAPVSSPLLSRECLSWGQQRVSCSAGGDGLHYSWSLDGLPLNDPRLPSGPSSASDVTPEPGRTGLLTCSVRNNVSNATANITLSVCDESSAPEADAAVRQPPTPPAPESAPVPPHEEGVFVTVHMPLVPFIARSLTVLLLLLALWGVYWGVYCLGSLLGTKEEENLQPSRHRAVLHGGR